MGYYLCAISVLFSLLAACALGDDDRRPIYDIARSANGILQMGYYLDEGANVVAADVQFRPSGRVKYVSSNGTCTGRRCPARTRLRRYLEHVRYITDPSTAGEARYKNFAHQLIMVYFNCVLSDEIDLGEAGRDLARHVLDYLWEGRKEQEARVLVYIESVAYNATLEGFMEEFRSRGNESRLSDVGFDGGSGDIGDIRRMFDSLGVEDNIWIAYDDQLQPSERLQEEIEMRDSGTSFFEKVYQKTVNDVIVEGESLELGVDGFLTDVAYPIKRTVELRYSDGFRMATPDDNPFERYTGNATM